MQPGTRQTLIRAASDLVDANGAYRSALAANATLLGALVQRLEDGEDVVAIVRSTPGGPVRVAARDAEVAHEVARSQYRSAYVSACVECGMTSKEIASSMGCSRQLVSRYL